MAKRKYNLLVVAHPDDESIFFAGLLLQKRKHPWRILCVTDGNADGKGRERAEDFARACAALKVKDCKILSYRDQFDQRLPVDELTALLRQETPEEIFTHGPVGEYGHPHHQDVSLAVHRAFPKKKIYSVAYNCAPDLLITLTPKNYAQKCHILGDIYHSETQRFLNFVPSTYCEGFVRLSLREVEAIYRFYAHRELPNPRLLRKYAWLYHHFEIHRENPIGRRPF